MFGEKEVDHEESRQGSAGQAYSPTLPSVYKEAGCTSSESEDQDSETFSLNSLASGPPPSYLEKGTRTEFREGSHRRRGKGRSDTGGLPERGTLQGE